MSEVELRGGSELRGHLNLSVGVCVRESEDFPVDPPGSVYVTHRQPGSVYVTHGRTSVPTDTGANAHFNSNLLFHYI